MADEEVTLPERMSVVSDYQGSRKGLGGATRQVYAWVGTYFEERVGDVTVCLAKRPVDRSRPDPDQEIEAEIRFDVDDDFDVHTKLPPGLEVRQVGGDSLLVHTYEGPLTGLNGDILPWLIETSSENDVKPGYRQRMVVMKKRPTEPGWVVEVQLVKG